MRGRTWTRLLAVLVALSLGASAAACSGGDDGDAEVSAGSGSESSGDSPEDGSEGLDAAREAAERLGGDELGECLEVGLAFTSLSLGAGFGSLGAAFGADPEEAEDLADELASLRDEVPDEIQDDFSTVADAYQQMLSDLDLGDDEAPNMLDPELQERMEEATSVMESPEVEAAMQDITDYLEEECPDSLGDMAPTP